MVLNDFKIGNKIGVGCYADVYQVADNNNKAVAIKIQTKSKESFIDKEYTIYQSLKDGLGIPTVIELGKYKGRSWMAMELLGESLIKLLVSCDNYFSLKTVLMLADQSIERLEFIHSRNVVHGDIKLDNILMGIGDKCHLVYLIDFGLSDSIRNEGAKEHISNNESNPLADNIITPSISSPKEAVNSDKSKDAPQTRGTDLSALGFALMSTFEKPSADEVPDERNEKKSFTYLESICSPHPEEFLTYMEYCMNLAKDQIPDYSYLRQLFKDLFARKDFILDYVYDWTHNEQV